MPKYSPDYLSKQIEKKLSHNFGVNAKDASDQLFYKASVLVLLDIMREKRADFKEKVNETQAKTIYYLSMEFLMGRSLKNSLYNLGLTENLEKALLKYDVKLEKLFDYEPDAGLGNGGLGRLAACFLDSLSSGNYSAMGYCLKYDFGIFRQKLVEGWQTELPDNWLPGGSVWLEERPASECEVNFDGYIDEWWDGDFHHVVHKNYTTVRAVPYDLMVAGNDGKAVNVLRLWSAKAPEINMSAFNRGDYVAAMENQAMSEAISKILYPEDNHIEGKSLRLRQQYFLVSASIQDILHRHLRHYNTLENLGDKVAIHINDTHPALSVPELMRFLLDECGYDWDKAWSIVNKTIAYTNHTVMSEALECWNEDLFKARLPRIYQIVKEIDNRFRYEMYEKTKDADIVEKTAVISGGFVRMANLSVVASHKVNGVSKLHSEILKNDLFNNYYKITPDKFTNVTNGIAHRRWLCQANPLLSGYIKELIGDGFINDASKLALLNDFRDDKAVLSKLEEVKFKNKERFAKFVNKEMGIFLNPESVFDIQAKRLHEYKRQHLNALHIIKDYLYIKNNPNAPFTPKTYIFGAKAAPGYLLAKQIIQMIYLLSKVIDNEPACKDKLKVLFLEDYRVTMAEYMIPAADISEQISLASTEASGTSNMKFMMNGAITLGTLDGANVEMREAVGDDNIIIFGMRTPEVMTLRKRGYNPKIYLENNPELKEILQFVKDNLGGESCESVYNTINNVDYYMALADYSDYCQAHKKVNALYNDRDLWNKMSLSNIANSGIFAADRSINEYAENIWHIKPVDLGGK